MDAFERINRIWTDCAEDYRKALGGNKAARTRVRKAMQEIKSAAQDVRVSMLEQDEKKPEGDGQ